MTNGEKGSFPRQMNTSFEVQLSHWVAATAAKHVTTYSQNDDL